RTGRLARRQRVPRGRRQPAPARAVRRAHRGPGAQGRAGRGRDPAHLLALRRLGDGRARRRPRQSVLSRRAVQPRRSRDDAGGANGVRPGPALQPGQDVSDAAVVRRQAGRLRRARDRDERRSRPRMTTIAIAGVVPRDVVTPRSIDELAQIVHELHEARKPFAFIGGGTHVALGNAPRALDTVVRMTALDAVVDYTPEDQTITVEAGITVAELDRVLAQHGQMLPLD